MRNAANKTRPQIPKPVLPLWRIYLLLVVGYTLFEGVTLGHYRDRVGVAVVITGLVLGWIMEWLQPTKYPPKQGGALVLREFWRILSACIYTWPLLFGESLRVLIGGVLEFHESRTLASSGAFLLGLLLLVWQYGTVRILRGFLVNNNPDHPANGV